MANMVKDKNFLMFTNNDGRTYKFDISTGVFYSAKTGNALKSTPSGLPTYIEGLYSERSTVLQYMYNQHNRGVKYHNFGRYAEMLVVCDRLDSIGYKPNSSWAGLDDKLLQFISENFKAFSKAFKENADLTLAEFSKEYGRNKLFAELHIKEDEYYTSDIMNIVWELRNQFNQHELSLIAYYLSRGVYMFCGTNSSHSYRERFENFFKWCDFIGYIPTKDDFFKQYLMVKKNYIANKKSYDNKAIVHTLAKHEKCWQFENDLFEIFVPSTVDDFKYEADIQNNCVYTMYLERVINGTTNIVFVRKKDNPTHPYITCEVDNYGDIRQFYLANNCSVAYNGVEAEFRNAFAEYIRKNWN